MPFVFLFTVNLQEVQPKKDVTRNISQKQQQTQVKERRKSDENKQGKGRARYTDCNRSNCHCLHDIVALSLICFPLPHKL